MKHRSSGLVLAACALAACGGSTTPAPRPSTTPAAPSPPRIERWNVAGGFDTDGLTMLSAHGDTLWVTHSSAVGVYTDSLTKPETRFASKDSPVFKRPVEFWTNVCVSNGHVFVVGQSLEHTPPFGILLHGLASAGPLAPVKTTMKLPSLHAAWCNERFAYVAGGGTLLRASTETEAGAVDFKPVPVDTSPGLSQIDGVGDDVWGVGADGLVVHGANDAWGKVTSGASVHLNAVKVKAAGDVWVGGDKETLLHTTDAGKSWTKVPIDTYTKQNLLAVYADEKIVLVGDACGAVYASEDGGAHFQREGELTRCGEGVYSFARRADGTLVAATAKFVYTRAANEAK